MRYKRILAVLTALSLLLCGCQSIGSYDAEFDEQGTNQEIHQEQDAGSVIPVGEDTLTSIAKIEEIPYPDGVYSLHDITPMGDGYVCIGQTCGKEIYETHIIRYNADFTEWTETVLVPLSSYDGYYYAGCLTDYKEDAYYTLSVMENHSNMEPYEEGDVDYDWEAYWESCESEYYLCTYSADGTLAGKVKIEGLEEDKDRSGYDVFEDLYCDGENTYLSFGNGAIDRINADGTLTEIVPGEERISGFTSSRFLCDRDSRPVLYTIDETVSDEGYYILTHILSDFDSTTGKAGEPFFTTEGTEPSVTSIVSGGCGDYRIFVNEQEESSTGMSTQKLYGIKDDGTKELVIDWDASDMEGMDVTPLADGTFIGEKDDKLYRVSRKYASEIKEAQTITIGVLGTDYYVMEFKREFNRTHDDYDLQIIVYNNSDGSTFGYPDAINDAVDQLKLAVMSDKAPDLIFMEGEGDYHDTFLRLGSRGVFCDLYEFMEGDTEINRDVLLPNILTAMQHPNGSLYSMTSGFKVNSIAVKSKFTDKENWTMDDMIELYDGADDMLYYWRTKQEMLRMLMTGTSFTDEISGTCSFDSPEFIKMLEFCNRYPLESNCPDSNKEDQIQWDKYMQWVTDSYHRYQEDTDYLFDTGFSGFTGQGTIASAWAYTKADLGGDFTLVGYPSNNGKGGKITAEGEIAITTNCTDKAAAWEVVKSYLRYQPSAGYLSTTGYSVFNERFEELLDNEMYIWGWGERTDDEYYDDDSRVFRLTQEERDRLEKYIRSCDTYMMLDEKVEAIVYEEAGMYFSGDRSVEDTAKMIQNRAEIYLSEQS